MSLFTSDWHLNHRLILEKLNLTSEQYEDLIFTNIREKAKPGEILYNLGDLGNITQLDLERILNTLGKMKLSMQIIIGNHDKIKSYKHPVLQGFFYYKTIRVGKQHIFLSHYPQLTWDKSHYSCWGLHGHIHKDDHTYNKMKELGWENSPFSGKQLNVNVDQHEFKPLTFDEVKSLMDNKKRNFDFIRTNNG